jgi:hypothetical protein
MLILRLALHLCYPRFLQDPRGGADRHGLSDRRLVFCATIVYLLLNRVN